MPGIRTHNLSRQAAADHWDRLCLNLIPKNIKQILIWFYTAKSFVFERNEKCKIYDLHLLNLIPDKAVTCSRNTNRIRYGISQMGKKSNFLGSAVIKGALPHTCRRNN